MQAADEGGAKPPIPRILVHVGRGIAEIHATAELEIIVAYDDFEVWCDGAFQVCSLDEFQRLAQSVCSYRYDPLFCKSQAHSG